MARTARMARDPNSRLPAGAAAALRAGDTIEAVKIVREATGLGLAEAKALVEAAAAPAAVAARDGELPGAAIAALHAGRMIDAVRIVREQRRTGLKDAKDAVDAYLAGHAAVRARVDAAQAQARRTLINWAVAIALVAALGVYFLAA